MCVPDLMWLREASIRSMKEAGTVIVFLVSSNISSFRVMTLRDERKVVRKREEDVNNPSKDQSMPWRLQTPGFTELPSSVQKQSALFSNTSHLLSLWIYDFHCFCAVMRKSAGKKNCWVWEMGSLLCWSQQPVSLA